MYSIIRIVAFFSAASTIVSSGASPVNLRDLIWELSNCDGTIRVPGSIPGEVHTDLMKANVISSNPYFRYNELNQVNFNDSFYLCCLFSALIYSNKSFFN